MRGASAGARPDRSPASVRAGPADPARVGDRVGDVSRPGAVSMGPRAGSLSGPKRPPHQARGEGDRAGGAHRLDPNENAPVVELPLCRTRLSSGHVAADTARLRLPGIGTAR